MTTEDLLEALISSGVKAYKKLNKIRIYYFQMIYKYKISISYFFHR